MFDNYSQWVPDNSDVDIPNDTFPDVGMDPLDYPDSIGDTSSPPLGQ
jgi:hypothetical protein